VLGGHFTTISCAHAFIACAFALVIIVWVDGTQMLLPTHTVRISGWYTRKATKNMYQPTAALVCELLVFSICCSPVDAIDSHVTGEIILPWFLSPLFSCLIAAALVFYLMKTHGVGDDEEENESQLQWRKTRMVATTLTSDDEDEDDYVFDDEEDHYEFDDEADHYELDDVATTTTTTTTTLFNVSDVTIGQEKEDEDGVWRVSKKHDNHIQWELFRPKMDINKEFNLNKLLKVKNLQHPKLKHQNSYICPVCGFKYVPHRSFNMRNAYRSLTAHLKKHVSEDNDDGLIAYLNYMLQYKIPINELRLKMIPKSKTRFGTIFANVALYMCNNGYKLCGFGVKARDKFLKDVTDDDEYDTIIKCFNQKSSSKSPRLRLLLTLEFTMHIYNSYYKFNDNDGNLFYRYKTGGGIYILKFFPELSQHSKERQKGSGCSARRSSGRKENSTRRYNICHSLSLGRKDHKRAHLTLKDDKLTIMDNCEAQLRGLNIPWNVINTFGSEAANCVRMKRKESVNNQVKLTEENYKAMMIKFGDLCRNDVKKKIKRL
jgi:phosphate/sulfate permease